MASARTSSQRWRPDSEDRAKTKSICGLCSQGIPRGCFFWGDDLMPGVCGNTQTCGGINSHKGQRPTTAASNPHLPRTTHYGQEAPPPLILPTAVVPKISCRLAPTNRPGAYGCRALHSCLKPIKSFAGWSPYTTSPYIPRQPKLTLTTKREGTTFEIACAGTQCRSIQVVPLTRGTQGAYPSQRGKRSFYFRGGLVFN